jgi:hypothetical protein
MAGLAIAGLMAAMLPGAATAAGAQKFELLGPNGNAYCNGNGVFAGGPGGFGFAIINAPASGTVTATVSLKGLSPNTDYFVRLIQGAVGCFTNDGVITTNGKGNGTTAISEESVSTRAVVFVVGPAQFYVTQTYSH